MPNHVEDVHTILKNFLKLKGSRQKQSSGGTNHNNNVKARMPGHGFQQQNFDDFIVFDADFPHHNGDDAITGVDQN